MQHAPIQTPRKPNNNNDFRAFCPLVQVQSLRFRHSGRFEHVSHKNGAQTARFLLKTHTIRRPRTRIPAVFCRFVQARAAPCNTEMQHGNAKKGILTDPLSLFVVLQRLRDQLVDHLADGFTRFLDLTAQPVAGTHFDHRGDQILTAPPRGLRLRVAPRGLACRRARDRRLPCRG